MPIIHNFVLKIETRWAARLINESWDVYNKTFDSLSKSTDKKEKKKKKKQDISDNLSVCVLSLIL